RCDHGRGGGDGVRGAAEESGRLLAERIVDVVEGAELRVVEETPGDADRHGGYQQGHDVDAGEDRAQAAAEALQKERHAEPNRDLAHERPDQDDQRVAQGAEAGRIMEEAGPYAEPDVAGRPDTVPRAHGTPV